MQFADPQAISTAYLILRHLYDGDVIEWPIADDHPLQAIFAGLEAQGYVARWDRVWPLHDRYRLTELGIRAIEAVYRPAGAEQFMSGLRQQGMTPAQRRAALEAQRMDPRIWPLLHDPSTHWSTFWNSGSRYQHFFWEDQAPERPTRRARLRKHPPTRRDREPDEIIPILHHTHHHPPHHVVDLDRGEEPVAPAAHDYDVS